MEKMVLTPSCMTGDDDKFWAYVMVTSAIAHRAPILPVPHYLDALMILDSDCTTLDLMHGSIIGDVTTWKNGTVVRSDA